jgi:hypothetical protein
MSRLVLVVGAGVAWLAGAGVAMAHQEGHIVEMPVVSLARPHHRPDCRVVEPDDSSRLIEIFLPIQQVDLANEIFKNPLPTMGVLLRSSNEIGGMFFRTRLLWTYEMLA